VLLAKQICLFAGLEAVEMAVLVPALKEYVAPVSHSYGYRRFQVIYGILKRADGCTLVENLWRFSKKICLHPRDAVYSLVHISGWLMLRCRLHFNAS
jgi:hypothetical protein